MEVQVVDSGPCRRSLTIKLSPEKIKKHVDEVYKSASKQVEIKGFRAGKIPRQVLEKRFGSEILAEAKETLVSQSFEAACTEKDIAFIGKPEVVGLDDSPLDPDAGLEFQVHLDIKPELTISRVKGIEVKAGDTAVTEDDVKAGLGQLAEQKRTLQTVDDVVEEGDFVKADMIFKVGDETVHERKSTQLNTNIPLAGTDQEVFKNNLLGSEKGKTFELDLKFPDSFEKEGVRGKDGKVEIHVNEVMRVTPPVMDDAFAKGFEFETMDALTEEVRKRIGEEKATSDKARIEGEIIQTIMMENPFEVPASLIEDQKEHLLQQAGEQMKQQGMDAAAIKAELEKHEEEAATEAAQRVKVFFLLEAIARGEKVFVTEGDVDVELRNIAAANQASPQDVQKHYEENNLMDDMRWGIRERKVRDFLRENAKITDK
jgi:trigger factor